MQNYRFASLSFLLSEISVPRLSAASCSNLWLSETITGPRPLLPAWLFFLSRLSGKFPEGGEVNFPLLQFHILSNPD